MSVDTEPEWWRRHILLLMEPSKSDFYHLLQEHDHLRAGVFIDDRSSKHLFPPLIMSDRHTCDKIRFEILAAVKAVRHGSEVMGRMFAGRPIIVTTTLRELIPATLNLKAKS